jgi:hypothetical protein
MVDRSLMAAAVAVLSTVAAAAAALPTVAQAQSVQALKRPPPDGAQLTFLLTDGTVLAQGNAHSDRFWVLTPDKTGSYVNGTWKRVGNLPTGYSPSAMASAVLADGRVVIEGGEYNFGNSRLPIWAPSTIRSRAPGPPSPRPKAGRISATHRRSCCRTAISCWATNWTRGSPNSIRRP